MRIKSVSALAVVLALACSTGPSALDLPSQVDRKIADGDIPGACGGLFPEAPDDTREHAAKKLAAIPEGVTCICERIYDPVKHEVDASIVVGLADTKADGPAVCLGKALSDPAVADKAAVAEGISKIGAPKGFDALADVGQNDADPAVRALALGGLVKSVDHAPILQHAALADKDPAVRAAAIDALGRVGGADPHDVLVGALEDPDPGVKASAAQALAGRSKDADDDMLCKLLDDPEERVRGAVVSGWLGVRRDAPIKCMARRLPKEPSEPVRGAILQVVGGARTETAKNELCDGIGPYVKAWVVSKETIPAEDSKFDIVKWQNDIDWDRSYDCVGKAVGKGGYSCYGRYHLAWWYERLGGKGKLPKCPGMEPVEGGGGGEPQEMEF